MPTTPIVERQVQANKLPVNEISLPKGHGRYIEPTVMNNLAKAVDAYADNAKKRGDQVSLIEAQRKLDEWDAVNVFSPETGALAKKGKDAFDLPNRLGADFDKYGQEIFDGLANDDQKIAFQKMWYDRADTLNRTLMGHERQQMDSFASRESNALKDSSVNRASLYYNVPSVIDQSINDARFAARTQASVDGLSDQATELAELEAESKVRLGALTRMADADPRAAIEFYKTYAHRFTAEDLLRAQNLMSPAERKYKASDTANRAVAQMVPKVTSTDMIDYVMYELEGGDKVVIDNDGGTTKFGINSKHNDMTPEEVAALTPEDARKLKKERYWDAMKIDDLPADMRLVAYDAAINHGADADTKKMIEEADGDPRKLIELRRDYYMKLAKDNPTQNGDQLEGWMNRLAKLSAQVDLMRGQEPSLTELNARIDEMTDDVEVAADAKALLKTARETRQADIKAGQQAASDEANNYVLNRLPVPASVEARMKPEDAVQMRKMQNEGMEPDPVFYADVRTKVLTGQQLTDEQGNPVDLKDLRWVLGNKYEEIAKLQSDPSKLVNARTTDEIIKSAYGRIIGKSTPGNKKDYETIEDFRRIIDGEIDAYQKATNKIASPDEVQKIIDRNMMMVNPKGWRGNQRRFTLEDGTQFTVDGIPDDRNYFIVKDGKASQIGYDDLVTDLIAVAQRKNIQLTNENLRKMYQRAKATGQLVEKNR